MQPTINRRNSYIIGVLAKSGPLVKNSLLPEFQDFLLSRPLVDAKNAPFYPFNKKKRVETVLLITQKRNLMVFIKGKKFKITTSGSHQGALRCL